MKKVMKNVIKHNHLEYTIFFLKGLNDLYDIIKAQFYSQILHLILIVFFSLILQQQGS